MDSLAKTANVDKDAVLKAQSKVSSRISNVLGAVGTTAFSLLAEQIKHSRANQEGNGDGDGDGDGDSTGGNRGSGSQAPTFGAFFEDHLGQSHLDALQLLSSTTSSQAVSTKKKMPIKQKTKVNKLAAGLKTTLTIEDDDDDNGADEEDGDELEGQATFEAAVAALGKIASESERLSDDRLRAAGEAAAAFLATAGGGGDADGKVDAEDAGVGDGCDEGSAAATSEGNAATAAAALSKNAKLHREAISRMAHIVSTFVELCRKVAEIVILEGASRDDDTVTSEEIDAAVLERAPALRTATVQLSSYLAYFADTSVELFEEADDDADTLSTSIIVELDEARTRAELALKLLHPVFHLALMHL